MTEELYINGEKVDVATTGITFTMKSNLFGELGKITAGNSQTVKLPRTVKNMRILNLPEVVSRNCNKVRKKIKATLLRNGIPIIKDGEAVVINVSKDAYEIGITYGVVAFLTDVKDGGNLNELPDGGEYLEWNKDSVANNKVYSEGAFAYYGYADYSNGLDDTNRANVHPLVSLEWLMQLIESNYGFYMQFGGTVREKFRDMYIMLADKKNSKAAIDNFVGEYSATTWDQIPSQVACRVELSPATQNYKTRMWGHYVRFEQAVSYIDLNVVLTPEKVIPNGTLYLCVNLNANMRPSVQTHTILATATADDSGQYVISLSGTTNIIAGDRICLVMESTENIMSYAYTAKMTLQCSYVWADGVEPDDITYPSVIYPIVSNLPSVKLTDFIRMLGLLVGKFPILNYGETDTLRFAGVEDLRDRMSEAADWSDKWDGEPTSVSFTYMEGIKNIIDYKNDDDVFVPTRGSINVNDDTLEKEAELGEIPLSGSNDVIPQYSLINGTVEEGDVSARLLRVTEDNEATFAGLSMAERVPQWYAGYQDVMLEPIVIKGTFRLTEIDIMQLDYLRPVYLRQTGRYYGIVQVQYKGETSEVELIQI